MRAVHIAVVAAVALAVGAGMAVARDGESTTGGYRVDAIFDTAKGIIPGQLAKIAGARVGTVERVSLTPDYKARISMVVDERFAPFRADASCSIQPEGLIAENFVQCDPGTPDAPRLQAVGGEAPTVPVDRNSVPVGLTDLFNIFRTPVRQRFSVVVSSLGLGTAARGDDFNDVIRRANPTLKLVQRTLGILDRQRGQLSATVRHTDRVVAQLARRRGDVQEFLEHSRVAAVIADRRRPLAQGIRQLPALLDEVQPLARRLHVLTRDSTPVLRDLRVASPDLRRLIDDLEPAAVAGRPALHELREAAVQGRATARSAEPTVKLLRRFAGDAEPVAELLAEALVDLKRQGIPENLVNFAYFATAGLARFDQDGHIFAAHPFISADCSPYANAPVAGCNTFYRGGDALLSGSALDAASLASLGLAGAAGAGPQEDAEAEEDAGETGGDGPEDVVEDVVGDAEDVVEDAVDTVEDALPSDPDPPTDLLDLLLR